MPDSQPGGRLGLYRAGLTGPEHRRRITVGRDAVFQDTIEILRKNIGRKPRHHLLLIGPRGIGKSHLLSLLEDEIHRDAELSAGYHVVRFPEESHRILSFADFLLGLCENLRETLPGEPQWGELYQRLATEERNEILVDTLVPAIRKRRRESQQALVIMLENLHQVFEQQIKDYRSIAALRGFLMEDNGCLLIATAPLHFGAITDHKQPFYDFFDVQILDQLTEEQTIELIHRNLEWEGRMDLLGDFVSLRPRLLALYRMTGGSPRLTLMLYELLAHEAVSDVRQQFEILLDRITPYYQDRMRDLGPQERAVLETMATMRDQPKTPGAIAARMRMRPAQVSTLLSRLLKGQYLRWIEDPDDKRSRFYTIREGFFDLWLAMNVSRGARQRLPFLVEFFAQFYPSIEARNRKREEYRRRLASGEFDAPRTDVARTYVARADVARADLREALDYLSEQGSEEERAREKIRLAAMSVCEGNPERAQGYLHEVRKLPLDEMGTWIVRRSELEPQLDYLKDIEELIACWDSHRAGELESFVEKMRTLGQELSFRSWSETKIAFLQDHLSLLPVARERIETRLRLGDHLCAQARWSEAEREFRAALDEATQTADDTLIACAMSNQAQLLLATNRVSEAEPLMRRALAIDEQSYGDEHPSVARDLNNLAQLLQATNRLADAEPLMRRALAIDEQCGGGDSPSVARDLNNLAGLLQATNRLAEAEPLMRRALAIEETFCGTEHPNFARALNNLAQLLMEKWRRLPDCDDAGAASRSQEACATLLTAAERLMRRALAIDEQTYGGKHPAVARHLHNLAALLKEKWRRLPDCDDAGVASRSQEARATFLTEAERLMSRGLAIVEDCYGVEHPIVANYLNIVAQLLQARADDAGKHHDSDSRATLLAEAEPLMRRALAIDEQSCGADHPDVARSLNNLAQLLQEKWRRLPACDVASVENRRLEACAALLAEAESLMARAVSILAGFTRQTGHEHPYRQTAVENHRRLLARMDLPPDDNQRRLRQAGGE